MDLAYIATAFLLVQGTKKKESRAKNLETEIGVFWLHRASDPKIGIATRSGKSWLRIAMCQLDRVNCWKRIPLLVFC